MSLEAHGVQFTVSLVPFRTPLTDTRTGEKLPEVAFRAATCNNDPQSYRKTFLQAMSEFANSKQFEALTYELNHEFVLKVDGIVNLTMPTR